VLEEQGHDVVPISRSAGVDVVTGDGLADALRGVESLAHERAMLAGPIPATIVRAAQFHEFVAQLMEWARQDGTIYLPNMRTQLVAARTVAETLADIATGRGPAPARGSDGAPILEIAGPREERLVEAARLLAEHRGEAVRIEAVSNPDDPDGALYESGAPLPGPRAILAGRIFAEWLRAQNDEEV
jgi:hypothetical protein